MNRRMAFIENAKVLADSGEVTGNLGLRDIITSMFVEFRATNGASGNKANLVADCVSSFELIDGSKTIISLTGHQLAALTYYQRSYIPYTLFTECSSNVQNLVGEIMFGRWHGDVSYALDPSRFTNLQYRIKWNLAAVRALAATSFATGTMTFTLIADIMEGVQSPQGYLSAKQHFSFTTGASGTEYIDLPIDQRVRGIMLRSALAGTGGIAGISNIKLSCDQGKFIPIDVTAAQAQRIATLKNPPFHYKHFFYAKDADTLYPVLKKDEALSLVVEAGDNVACYHNDGVGSGALDLLVGGAAQTAEQLLTAIVEGFSPFNTLYLDMGEYDDPGTWLDLTMFRAARLELGMNAASGVASVVLSQEVAY